MANEVQVFKFEKTKQIRTIEKDGITWFIGKDVCNALELKNSREAIRKLESDEKNTVISNDGNRGNPNMTVVSEAGVYSLIFQSRKPQAKRFLRWVTHEVLPAIRKHGMYLTDALEEKFKTDPEEFKVLAEKYFEEKEKNKKLQEILEEERVYSTLGRAVLALQDSISMKDASGFLAQKGIPIGQNRLYKYCRDNGLVCKRKGKQWNKPTQKALEKGILGLQLENGFYPITMVTPEGLKYFSNVFMQEHRPLIFLMETA